MVVLFTMLRGLLIGGGLLLAFLLLVVLRHPWLLAWTARVAAGSFGVEAQGWAAEGYETLVVTNPQGSFGGTEISGGEIRIALPFRYLGALGATNPDPVVAVRGLEIVVGDSPPESEEPADTEEPSEPGPQNVPEVFGQVKGILEQVRTWLPAAQIADVTIRLAERTILVDSVVWRDGELDAQLALPDEDASVRLAAELPITFELEVSTETMPELGALNVEIESSPERVAIEGTGRVGETPLSFTTLFDTMGWLPSSARISSDAVRLAGKTIGLAELETLGGTAEASWENRTWALQADLSGTWFTQPGEPEEFTIVGDATGTLQALTLRGLEIAHPLFSASLSDPVRVTLPELQTENAATLTAAVDMTALGLGPVGGTMDLRLKLSPEGLGTGETRLAFDVEGDGLLLGENPVGTLRVAGLFAYPRLELDRFSVEAPEGSEVSGEAKLDVQARILEEASLAVNVQREDLLRWEESLPVFGELSAEWTASGPFSDLTHEGEISLEGFENPVLHPLDLNLAWTAESLLDLTWTAEIANSGGTISLEAALAQTETGFALRLDTLDLGIEGDSYATLASPSTITFGATPELPLALEVGSFTLVQREGAELISLAGRWTSAGPDGLDVSIANLATPVFNPMLLEPAMVASIEAFTLRAATREASPAFVAADVSLRGEVEVATDLRARMDIVSQLDRRGLNLEELAIGLPEQTLVTGQGALPFLLERTDEALALRWGSEGGDLDFRFRLQSTPAVEVFLEERFGLTLSDPSIVLTVEGTATQPIAHLQAMFARLEGGDEFLPAPLDFQELSLEAALTEEEVVVEVLEIRIDEAPVRMTAQMPLGEGGFATLMTPDEIPLDDLSGTFTAEALPVFALAKFAGAQAMLRDGELTADLTWRGDLTLQGDLELRDGATRPLPTGTPVRDLALVLRAEGRRLQLETLDLVMGGEKLQGEGFLDFAELSDPTYELRLEGRRIPLQRSGTAIIRSDLAITLTREADKTAILRGRVNLVDSLMLQDLTALASSGTASASSRPPYFSVEADPFGEWQLDLDIKGDRFLRIQSTFFNGRISADFQLLGTLAEPQLFGRATIAENSKISFPFGNLSVQTGEVRLTRENPYEFQLDVLADGRAIGYSIELVAAGMASNPRIEFSSVPSLPQEDILLLLTAGIVPDGEMGAAARAQRIALYLGRGLYAQLFGGGEGESVADRIEIRSGSEISEEGRETYEIEFEVNDRWSAVGEYDRFDEYNLGAKYDLIER